MNTSTSTVLLPFFAFGFCALTYGNGAANSARFATVRFLFRYRGRVRVALSEQDAASGRVDTLLDEVLPAGAEDFDQVSGTGEGVEVEVRLHTHTMNLWSSLVASSCILPI
jgi:transcriptional/translational regulatory protein YebC/TACO1